VFVTCWLVLGLAIVTGSWASDLVVKPGAANAGSYGLEVAVGKSCTAGDNYVVPNGTIAGPATEEGCLTLTAADVDITAGSVTFQAGDSITLQNGFSVASGANFTAAVDQGLTGRAYVQDNSPSAEKLYRARFYLDPTNLTPGSGDTFDHFTAYANSGAVQFQLRLLENGSNIDLVVNARDGGAYSSITAESSLPSSYIAVEFEWKASDAGMSNGHLDVWVDGSPAAAGLASLDNENGQIDYVRWGAVDGVDNTTSGTMDLDDFVSQRSSTEIGTLPP
jgi:hypothetical protein